MEQFVPPEIGYKKPPQQTKGFAAATAEVTGESKAKINRNLARPKHSAARRWMIGLTPLVMRYSSVSMLNSRLCAQHSNTRQPRPHQPGYCAGFFFGRAIAV
ncbi:MAG: hypothetical protein K2Y10_08055 [Burkholderiaceae bacterium]|nr:hypothetical protein [Burkholderiaceae bacterium]